MVPFTAEYLSLFPSKKKAVQMAEGYCAFYVAITDFIVALLYLSRELCNQTVYGCLQTVIYVFNGHIYFIVSSAVLFLLVYTRY